MLMDGIYVPVAAPFYRDGASYWKKLEHNVGRYSLTPAAGLVALTGERGALSEAERRETLEVIAQAAAPEKVLVAAIAQDSVRGALAVAEEAERAGFDAVMLGGPLSWASLRAAERMVWFRAVADASPLPVMLYGDAVRGVLDVEILAELALHGNIWGLYDAGLTLQRLDAILAATREVQHEATVTTVFAPVTRRMLAVQEPAAGSATFVTAESLAGGAAVAVAPPKPAIKTRTKTVGFQVMAAGRVSGLVELLQAGVAGTMPALAACAPQGCYEAYAAFKDGDPALAAEKEQRLLAADALLGELGVAGIKYGCDLNGYYGGAPRLPRLPLDGEQRAQVERVLQGLRN
jgi:dihydrodipicolinate synthase/N-acetylneuraminate lyase